MNREQRRKGARDEQRLVRPAGPRRQPAAAARPTMDGRRSTTVTGTPGQPAEGRRRLPGWWPWATAATVLVVLVAAVVLLDPLGLRTPLPGAAVPSQGNVHTSPGAGHVAYRTDPPTSGPHFATVPRRGTYLTPFATEFLPHFMEHAGVVVQYNASAPPEVVQKLTDIVNKELDRSPGLVLLAPRPEMPCQVALTAWGRIATFGASGCQPGSVGHDFNPGAAGDVKLVQDFVERNACAYDPESQCGTGAHGQTTYPTVRPGEPTVIAALGSATPGSGSPTPAAPSATAQPGR